MPTNPETPIQSEIMVETGKLSHIRLFRNNVGRGVCGKMIRIEKTKTITLQAGDWVVKKGRIVDFGMPKGSPDTNGWEEITVTPEMVGKKIARVLLIEVKTPIGGLSDDQKRFIAMAREMGCKVLVCRSPEEAVAGIMNGELNTGGVL